MAADWEVEYQTKRTTFGGGGRPEDVREVHYVITSDPAQGERGWITIPESRYNRDAVKALIEAEVAEIKAVHSL